MSGTDNSDHVGATFFKGNLQAHCSRFMRDTNGQICPQAIRFHCDVAFKQTFFHFKSFKILLVKDILTKE